ncbi:sugar ABC transporter ATP-binding protein [Leucobacter allii]|uniref:Sugar ABC transporter ATP-binding protein n=1 Tax=Leucobacter allii TaxID=2932247 RepID=A0ABY4FKV4_9MICO|nr:sugar ABC transporter ATP-binding protein [Leucobacter allii]UOQ56875.1 sugar ABC transporter ATP-binding protein [Leucobacter allii]
MSGIVKEFPGLRALDDVSLDLASGEIVAVVGHNGSGKSTLVKILAGIYTEDAGEVHLANQAGEQSELYVIHQDLGLAAELTAIENLGLSRDTGLSALAPFRANAERAHARDLISRFGEPFDVDAPVGTLAPAQRSIIAIARALDGWAHPRNVLILDEPTEALHASEVEVLFAAVRRLAAAGAGVIFISHRLDEVMDLADRVVVLRDGTKVADEPTATLDHDRLVTFVTGVTKEEEAHGASGRGVGEVVLDVTGLTGAVIDDVDLQVRAGEVVGIAGVLGSGREALPAMVFGTEECSDRGFTLAGEPYARRSPRESIRRGIGFVPGDRAKYGSVHPLTARENMTLPNFSALTTRFGTVDERAERRQAAELVAEYGVRPPRPEQVFSQFSGGNQQKIVFAKWLRNDPSLLLLEEPTQGVDVGAKRAIYDAVDRVAADGTAVLVCSSDAKELVRLCDRVLVLRDGRVGAELSGDELTESRLIMEGYGLMSEESK